MSLIRLTRLILESTGRAYSWTKKEGEQERKDGVITTWNNEEMEI